MLPLGLCDKFEKIFSGCLFRLQNVIWPTLSPVSIVFILKVVQPAIVCFMVLVSTKTRIILVAYFS